MHRPPQVIGVMVAVDPIQHLDRHAKEGERVTIDLRSRPLITSMGIRTTKPAQSSPLPDHYQRAVSGSAIARAGIVATLLQSSHLNTLTGMVSIKRTRCQTMTVRQFGHSGSRTAATLFIETIQRGSITVL